MSMRWLVPAIALLFFAAPAAAGGIAPLDPAACAAMKAHHVLNAGAPVGCGRLAVVTFPYFDFDGRAHSDGRVVVLDAVAPSVERIFMTLFARRFPIAKAVPLETYDGDDDASMAANNTSAFNVRIVAGSTHQSLHAYGVAIDLNPVENPYLMRNGAVVNIAPPAGLDYLNRRAWRPGKSVHAGLAEDVVDVFADNGFVVWGGDWDDPIDYQHFDIGRSAAEKLVSLPPDVARVAFENAIAAYRHCVAQHADRLPQERRQVCAVPGPN